MSFDPDKQPEFVRRVTPLRDELLRLKHQLELAEACAEVLNPLIRELAGLGLIDETVLVGPQVGSRPYSGAVGIRDSDLTILAALRIPDGLGVVLWDSEAYADCPNDEVEAEAFVRFAPFARCCAADRARLLPSIDALVERFIHLLELQSAE